MESALQFLVADAPSVAKINVSSYLTTSSTCLEIWSRLLVAVTFNRVDTTMRSRRMIVVPLHILWNFNVVAKMRMGATPTTSPPVAPSPADQSTAAPISTAPFGGGTSAPVNLGPVAPPAPVAGTSTAAGKKNKKKNNNTKKKKKPVKRGKNSTRRLDKDYIIRILLQARNVN
jgi:hypothetical protein